LALDKVSSWVHTTAAITPNAWIFGEFLSNEYVVYRNVMWATNVEGMDTTVDKKENVKQRDIPTGSFLDGRII
jgi:hypothetical protein